MKTTSKELSQAVIQRDSNGIFTGYKLGKDILGVKRYSEHPDDWYLWVIIRRALHRNDEYAVYTYNEQDNGYSNGYYTGNLEVAYAKFNERGVK